ncbi:copper resistance protein CopC [Heyndrickxia sp. NPDC080065]|uniref:copper resistance protein CopC n=1 Tax=Heyndrickxia sp. NPDC080065 TaxID=3390568 RepID=UPI003D063B0A
MPRIITFAALCIGFFIFFLQAPPVEAHSTLLETTPAEKIVTEESPPTLKLRFNEPIEQDLAIVTIYDWNAKPVFTGKPDGDGAKRTSLLEFSLPKLKQGTYTVQWSVVSLDGHPVSGAYHFAVSKATKGGVKSVTGAGENKGPLIASRTIAEGLLLLGAGLFWFSWLAEKKHFPSLGSLFKRGRGIGAFVLVLATIAELITYAAALPSGLIQTIFNGRWDLLLQFPFILMVLAQLFFLIMLFIPGMMRGWYLFMWLALVIVPAFGGHVWGLENPIIALIPRIIHQLSIALWLGALCYVILLVIWQKKQEEGVSWKEFRPFFVNKMMVASGLVVISGIIMVFLQSGWIAVVTDWSGWSTLLLIKIIFTILMLSLALFQTLKWKRQQNFTTIKIIRVEWIAGLVVILMGVWMSQTAYPIASKSYNSTLTDGQAKAEVNISKLQVGEQRMIVQIPDVDGKLPEEVTVNLTMPDHGMKYSASSAGTKDSSEYQVNLPFSMIGTWRIEIIAKYPGGKQKEWTDDIFVAGGGNG